MAKFPVKFYYGGGSWFGSTQADYPRLTNDAGSLIALLDAVLVNGYGVKTVKSISIDENRKATLICDNHGYSIYARFEISGADQSDINGEWEVESVPDVNTIVFTAPKSLINTNITGNITIRVPPLGWDKVFSDTNQGVYRARVGNRHFLHVDDTFTNGAVAGAAKVRPFETMTDINQHPLNSWMAYGDSLKDTKIYSSSTGGSIASNKAVGWHHYIGDGGGVTGTTTDISWTIVGCDRFFYLSIQNMRGNTTLPYRAAYMFGDFPSIKIDDRKNVIIRGAKSFDSAYCYNTDFDASGSEFSFNKGSEGNYLASSFSQNSGNKYWCLMPSYPNFDKNPVGAFSGYYPVSKGPNIASGGYIFAGPCLLFEDYEGNDFQSGAAASVMRGYAPGLYVVPTNFVSSDYNSVLIKQNQLLSDSKGRRYITMGIKGGNYYYGSVGFHFLSIDEDWFAMDDVRQSI
jgi:hypothetical protein